MIKREKDSELEKCYRKAQSDCLNQINTLIDWKQIHTLINKKYTKWRKSPPLAEE